MLRVERECAQFTHMECAAVGVKTAVSRTLQTTNRRVAQLAQKVGGARAPAGLVGDAQTHGNDSAPRPPKLTSGIRPY